MFSNWFSGDECGQYRTSPHKQRMDHVGSSLLELRYANDVIRQHLPPLGSIQTPKSVPANRPPVVESNATAVIGISPAETCCSPTASPRETVREPEPAGRRFAPQLRHPMAASPSPRGSWESAELPEFQPVFAVVIGSGWRC
jgi:hypothetical protein